MIWFTVQSTSNISLLPSETGMPVTVTVALDENLASVDFTKRVILSLSITKEYEIIMIFTYIDGETEFVLTQKQSEFHFNSRESLLKQIIKFIN